MIKCFCNRIQKQSIKKVGMKNYSSVDLFKFFAAFLVVCIHTRPFYQNADADYFYTCFCRNAVPFFFCFSSFIFFKKNVSISTYVKRMLVLYFAWFLIELPFIYLRFFYNQPFTIASLKFTRGLLIHNTFYASWYITASWQAMLIVWYLSKKSSVLLYTIGLLFFLMTLLDSMYSGILTNYKYGCNIQVLLKLISASNSFIVAVPYCIMGRFLALNTIVWNKKIITIGLICLFIIAFFETSFCRHLYRENDSYISLLFITFFLMVYLINYNYDVPHTITIYCRKSSILIYLLHYIILFMLKTFYDLDFGFEMFIICLVVSMIIAYTIISYSERYPILKKFM